jgi:hypothetical protein
MANQKISELPELFVPSGSDLLPIVNQSTTKRITVSNFSAIVSAGPVGPVGPPGPTLGTYIPFHFNNIPNYDVPGDGVIRNLGDTTGMTLGFFPEANFVKGLYTSDDGTNWNFDVQLMVQAQYGGASIDTGFNLDFATSVNSSNTDIISTATRYNDILPSTYEVHYRAFTFLVPKIFLGNPVNYIKLNLIARRSVASPGNTGIVSAAVRFKNT